MNLPNRLTVARFVMALVFVALMSCRFLAGYIIAYVLFILAALTDYYDGKIARARGLVTNFGKLLDPVADKVLLTGAFVMLMGVPGLRIPGWTVVAIIAREFLITGIRSLAASGGHIIGANTWGKTKAVIQMVYVFTFLFLAIAVEVLRLYEQSAAWAPAVVAVSTRALGAASYLAIVFVAVVTIYSGVQFMRINWDTLDLGSQL